MKKLLALFLLALLTLSLSHQAFVSAETTNPRAACQALDTKNGPLAKVGFQLATTYCGDYTHVNSSLEQTGRQSAPDPADNPLILATELQGEQHVVIDAIASDDSQQLLAQLEALGLQHGAAFGPVVSGYLPIDAIGDAATLSNLNFARPAVATTHVGSVDSQGDPAMQTDDFRTNNSVDGSGITIGTLSDSYNCLGGAAAGVTSNDLPAGVNVLQDEVGCVSGTDEGRAMMELIHDVAPGSTQAFHTAFGGQADFAQGIIDLRTAGADSIVDDVGYFAEPFYQDGIIAQAVDTVVADGAVYFSSAGNAARNAYESPFVSGPDFTINFTSGPVTYDGHDFSGAGDNTQTINIPVNTTVRIIFQWASPYASANVGSSGATSDLDIFIATATSIVAASTDNNVGGDPTEIFTFTNNGSFGTTSFQILIGQFSGAPPAMMKYHFSGLGVSLGEYATDSGTSYGHSIAANGIGVGAAFYQQTPEFGTTPPVLESFSSAGGQRILFDANDNPVNILRNKPDFVAPDGTDNTFFGSDAEPNGDPNFFGTSAAAPHAAAFAALILDQDSTRALTPQQVYTKMIDSAVNMGPAGFDFDSGAGLIQANNVVLGTPTSVGLQTQEASARSAVLVIGLLASVLLSVLIVRFRPKSR